MPDRADTASAPPPPELLLERYLSGDDGAFGMLTARYEGALYAFLARMTGDARLAGEIFRQTFVKIAKNASVFDSRASFPAWLYRIARNAALDELRRRARRSAGADAPRAPDQPPRVREILAALPEEQREAFLLKEEAGLDFGQIGVVLGCGKETAKRRFRAAVEKIRAVIGEQGSAPVEEDGAV